MLNVAITLSIGEKDQKVYENFKDAGADRYLLRIETTCFRLYNKLHPKMSLNKRKACLFYLKKLGYEVGTGNLIGLPEQTDESLADDILFFQELNADMVGLGPFIPNKNTPLGNEIGGTFEKSLKIMAIVRLLMPDINIPATTAMETLNPKGRIIALQSGANVCMPNVNATDYRAKYELYPNKICIEEGAEKCRGCIENKIKSIGRTISQSYGYRISKD
jgi:biotin synthase